MKIMGESTREQWASKSCSLLGTHEWPTLPGLRDTCDLKKCFLGDRQSHPLGEIGRNCRVVERLNLGQHPCRGQGSKKGSPAGECCLCRHDTIR